MFMMVSLHRWNHNKKKYIYIYIFNGTILVIGPIQTKAYKIKKKGVQRNQTPDFFYRVIKTKNIVVKALFSLMVPYGHWSHSNQTKKIFFYMYDRHTQIMMTLKFVHVMI